MCEATTKKSCKALSLVTTQQAAACKLARMTAIQCTPKNALRQLSTADCLSPTAIAAVLPGPPASASPEPAHGRLQPSTELGSRHSVIRSLAGDQSDLPTGCISCVQGYNTRRGSQAVSTTKAQDLLGWLRRSLTRSQCEHSSLMLPTLSGGRKSFPPT